MLSSHSHNKDLAKPGHGTFFQKLFFAVIAIGAVVTIIYLMKKYTKDDKLYKPETIFSNFTSLRMPYYRGRIY